MYGCAAIFECQFSICNYEIKFMSGRHFPFSFQGKEKAGGDFLSSHSTQRIMEKQSHKVTVQKLRSHLSLQIFQQAIFLEKKLVMKGVEKNHGVGATLPRILKEMQWVPGPVGKLVWNTK